jgi:hypothetical protein
MISDCEIGGFGGVLLKERRILARFPGERLGVVGVLRDRGFKYGGGEKENDNSCDEP